MQPSIFGVFYRLFQFHLLALISMSIFRVAFLLYYGEEKIELYCSKKFIQAYPKFSFE